MKGLRTVVIGLAGGLALAGCAKKPVPPPPPPTVEQHVEKVPGGVQVSDVVTATAVVKKIDQRTRMVTLLGSDGQQQTLHVGPEVQNLPQVRRGDHVVVQYTESVALRLKKPGDPPEATVEQEVGRAEPGQMPGAEAAQVVKATAKIVRIDRADQTATPRGPTREAVHRQGEGPGDPRSGEGRRSRSGDLSRVARHLGPAGADAVVALRARA